ncbi:MAG: hypothetical protein R2698_10310 [Microthrixaceae bacterium]
MPVVRACRQACARDEHVVDGHAVRLGQSHRVGEAHVERAEGAGEATFAPQRAQRSVTRAELTDRGVGDPRHIPCRVPQTARMRGGVADLSEQPPGDPDLAPHDVLRGIGEGADETAEGMGLHVGCGYG